MASLINWESLSLLSIFTLRNTSNLLLKRRAGSSVFGLMEGRSCYIHGIRMAKCEEMASEMVQIRSGSVCSPMNFIAQVSRALLHPANTDLGLALPGALCSMLLAIHGGLSELLIGRSIETTSQMESGIDADGNLISSGHQGSGAIQTCKFSTKGQLVFSGTLRSGSGWGSQLEEDELS